jgi:outer membrane receptor for ferrienterochelin and colicins
MKRIAIILISIILLLPNTSLADGDETNILIKGHIVNSKGEHIPFASVTVEGTTIGTITNQSGHYTLTGLPQGTHVLQANSLGYRPRSTQIEIKRGQKKEINFKLEEDVLNMEEVVVTGDRTGTPRKKSSVIVNSLKPKLFETTQSKTLSEGLTFTPGVRVENSCQNCGFTQVRMNGMEGPYSQILINSRPIFSGLAGVYGLELIPSNMIERVEVIRGGGSALYGSNAIAGTINLILKDPINNAYEFGIDGGSTGIGLDGSGDPASDYSATFNTSLVSSDNKSGMALYGFYRDRQPYDANGDGFSEITSLKNITAGARLFHRFGARQKLTADFFHINEERRGGNKHEALPHMADIAEALTHNITTGALTYDRFFREKDKLSVYASGQRVDRDSYYGANRSLSDYGQTEDFSFSLGAQYNASLGESNLILGIEDKGAWLEDRKMGYPDVDNAGINFADSTVSIPYAQSRTIADQVTNTLGVFAQYKYTWNDWKISAGLRYDHYQITDQKKDGGGVSGNVLSPRLTLKYDVRESLQARVSYSQGYRAPQIYDEDLHIETSGARKVIHRNAADLTQETSHSYMASLDYNDQLGNTYVGLLVEGFYTHLQDAFVNDFGEPNENGTVVYTRINSDNGAVVQGVNLEMNLVPAGDVSFTGGFTIQTSDYQSPHAFNKEAFFRTPDDYGYLNLDWDPTEQFGLSASGSYTGRMLVPYFGNELANPEEGTLRRSPRFFDLGLKLTYQVAINEETNMELSAGIENMFNSYQSDFDRGIDRDPGYIYGPSEPRAIHFGIRIGNML